MRDSLPHSDQEEDVARRRKRSVFNLLAKKRSQPDKLSPTPRPRSSSPLWRCRESPDRKNEKADNPHSSAAASESKLDDNKDAQPNEKTAKPGAKTATAGSNKDNDMWTIADEKLRKDPQKRKKLEEYDRILERQFGVKLEPVGTLKRREQFLGFFSLEIEGLKKSETEELNTTRLSKCSNKAKRFFKSAADCIIASKDIITAAATPCLPASVACAGVAVLLSFCVQAADQRHLLFDGLDTISSSICRIAEYEKLLRNGGNQQTGEVTDLITTACCNIIEFQARAACFLQGNPMESAIRNAFKWDGWDNLLSAINEAETKVKDCAERKSMNDICKIFVKFDELKDEIGDGFSKLAETQEAIDRKQRVDTFLQLLYNNTCSYKASKDRNRERVTGTCDWFTDHHLFKEWNLPKESCRETSGLLYVTADFVKQGRVT